MLCTPEVWEACTTELTEIRQIALPIATMLLARFATEFTDISVLGHLGTNELAASSYALIFINFSCSLIWRGCGNAMKILCSQAYGAKNYELVGEWAQLGLVVVVISCVPIGVFWVFIDQVLAAFGTDPSIVQLAGQFSRISVIWLLPRALLTVMQNFFQATTSCSLHNLTLTLHTMASAHSTHLSPRMATFDVLKGVRDDACFSPTDRMWPSGSFRHKVGQPLGRHA